MDTTGQKVVCMVPARLGSKRVPKKNLRFLAGKPLIAYVIEAAKASGVFDEIYINSEADIFGEIAKDAGVRFYKRSEVLSSDVAINDEFLEDFMRNVQGDILVQCLPTSPLITPEEVRGFVQGMREGNYETFVSVVDHQIACMYKGEPVNFDKFDTHRSSQTMTPVQSYATLLMGYTYESFFHNRQKSGGAYHGASSRIGYYSLKGLSTIDIDHEEDFALAEVALHYRSHPQQYEKRYWQPRENVGSEYAEVDVPQILQKDGVMVCDFEHENVPLVHIPEVIADMDSQRSWCRRLVNTESNSATLIAQLPGEGNRLHYHPHWNEWWYIVSGQWKWEIEGQVYTVKEGDFVFIEKGKRHRITAMGDTPALRIAVSRADVPHIYPGT